MERRRRNGPIGGGAGGFFLSFCGTAGTQAGLVYDGENDILYLHDNVTDSLHTVNRADATTTLVGVSGQDISGLTYLGAVVPEPSTFALSLMGIVVLSWHAIRRRRRQAAVRSSVQRPA